MHAAAGATDTGGLDKLASAASAGGGGTSSPFAWLSDAAWRRVTNLGQLSSCAALGADMIKAAARWREWAGSSTPELERMPLVSITSQGGVCVPPAAGHHVLLLHTGLAHQDATAAHVCVGRDSTRPAPSGAHAVGEGCARGVHCTICTRIRQAMAALPGTSGAVASVRGACGSMPLT